MQGHESGQEVGPFHKVSQEKQVIPFKRKLRPLGKSRIVYVPAAFVKSFGLEEGKEYQFYVEVSR